MNLCERHKLLNRCAAGDSTDKQEKCKFYTIGRGGGRSCIEQRFDKFCVSDDAKKEPFDAENLGD